MQGFRHTHLVKYTGCLTRGPSHTLIRLTIRTITPPTLTWPSDLTPVDIPT